MDDRERRALLRAALLLLAVSLLRWAVAAEPSVVRASGNEADRLERHATATEEAISEAERRKRPLEPGERIDPNVATAAELDRLPGVGPATASAIVQARDSGVVFRVAEDLLVARGIGPSTLGKIRASLSLGSHFVRRDGRGRSRPERSEASGPPRQPVDINRADAAALERLPGIGPALALRIVEERASRPFGSVAELERVRGIGPATVARLEGTVIAGVPR